MRISDWSSDVCSSDLARDHDLGRLIRCGQQRQPQQLRFVGAGIRGRQCRRAQPAIPGDRAADFQAEAVAMTGVRTLLRRLRRSERGTAFVEFARSEEHTSELQSLMRISYAVFCLKKKNTKQQK